MFTDPGTIEVMCRRMEESGFLEAKDMTRTFTMLRANDLLFRYVVDNWLLGENPPAFDLLAWNDDGTRMPGKAHSYFARKMYIENALAHDEMEALGERLIMSNITTDTYIVAAVDDHIVPWSSSYKSTQLFKGPIRFVLTSAGHIAGIVNPPGPEGSPVDQRRPAERSRAVARVGGGAQGIVVGRLGALDRRPRRCTRRAARDGRHLPPADRRRAGHVCQELTPTRIRCGSATTASGCRCAAPTAVHCSC